MSKRLQDAVKDLRRQGFTRAQILVAVGDEFGRASREEEQTLVDTASDTTMDFFDDFEGPEGNRYEEPGGPRDEGPGRRRDTRSVIEAVSSAARMDDGHPRYDDLGPLGVGGMGEVRRVLDRQLGRTLAFKTSHAPSAGSSTLAARFLEEAQATAQLQHPGIVPVYDLGELPDGRLWFTMKEVSGQTFGEVITEVHAVSRQRWEVAPSGWALRRLVDVLQQVCEAVGYAHSRGVVHRDLKPDNVMVGSFGEVLVLDWGLAKVLGQTDLAAEEGALDPVRTERSADAANQTLAGQVAGTPAYMPPEQAVGQVDRIDARSDVYALGAILYHVLSGRAPFTGDSGLEVLDKVRGGPPVSLMMRDGSSDTLTLGFGFWTEEARPRRGPILPAALVAACEKAMEREPDARFSSAVELGSELRAWLEGAKRREEARGVVARAEEKKPRARALRMQAAALRKEASAMLENVESWRPEEDKLPGWMKEDEAAALEEKAERMALEEERLLQGSLTHAPDLLEAHAALTSRYRAEHAAAEAARRDTARSEALFRQHLAALPDDHADRPGHVRYLKGDGTLSLVTDPPGAEVLLHRYVLQNRRLMARFERSLGTTPLDEVTLPMGSYLCILKHPECHDVRYPVAVGRSEHWCGVPSGGRDPDPILLPRLGELGPEDCYVPAGWFQSGRSEAGGGASLPPRRRWVGGHVFRRFSTSNRQYLEFLDALVVEGRTADALRYAPRQQGGTTGEEGALIYGFDGSHFSLRPDAEGDVWKPEWPVCFVEWFGANAFAAWESRRTGRPWQLPGELAWEKAARGVDGRSYPWGEAFDPSWACMDRSHRGRLLPADVGTFLVDESPYGVQDMAGNMQDWCMDVFVEDGPAAPSAREHAAEREGSLRVFRGGSWLFPESLLRTFVRGRLEPGYRGTQLGFRLARPYPTVSEP